MKTLQILLITFLLGVSVWAADLVVTVPDIDIPRVQEAYGSILNLGRNATPAEVSQAITNWLHQSTLDYERRKNTYTFTPPPMHFPTPTPTPGGLQAGPQLQPGDTIRVNPDTSLSKITPTPTATPKPKKK